MLFVRRGAYSVEIRAGNGFVFSLGCAVGTYTCVIQIGRGFDRGLNQFMLMGYVFAGWTSCLQTGIYHILGVFVYKGVNKSMNTLTALYAYPPWFAHAKSVSLLLHNPETPHFLSVVALDQAVSHGNELLHVNQFGDNIAGVDTLNPPSTIPPNRSGEKTNSLVYITSGLQAIPA